ncbi:MAG: protein-disulfide reductase DsbD [Ignavibacterium sp.]
MKKLKFVLIIIFILLLSNSIFAQFNFDKQLIQTEKYLSFDKIYSGSEIKFAIKVKIDSSWHINSNRPNEDFLIPTEIKISSNNYVSLAKTIYPKGEDLKFSFNDKPLSVYEDEIIIGGIIKISKDIPLGEHKINFTLNYQACNNSTCLPPNELNDSLIINIVDNKTAIQEINQDIFNKLDLTYSNIDSEIKEENTLQSTLENSGLLVSLILVFIGGLALNLTPCVYPLIPITIGYFGGQSEGRTSRLVLMGLLYLIGMSITYSIIGVITALTGAVFGSLLQNTFVIILIALIFVVLSLSMFGVYEFRLPNWLMNKAGASYTGLFGSFFMGLTMGIIAAPCIGPFVLGLVTYVAAKGDVLNGFLLFFFLSIGLGLPYFILAIFSGKIKQLPKSGEWMEGVKHIFGIILLGMAIYFLSPLFTKEISKLLLPIYIIVAGIYLIFFDNTANKIRVFKIFKISLSVILIFVSSYLLFPKENPSIEWKKFGEQEYNKALNQNEKIIIDFYADWCIPCKELDAITFSNSEVINKTKDFTLLKVDMTKSISPEVEKLKQKFSIVGVPTVLIVDSSGKEKKRITGFIEPEEFLKMID